MLSIKDSELIGIGKSRQSRQVVLFEKQAIFKYEYVCNSHDVNTWEEMTSKESVDFAIKQF